MKNVFGDENIIELNDESGIESIYKNNEEVHT